MMVVDRVKSVYYDSCVYDDDGKWYWWLIRWNDDVINYASNYYAAQDYHYYDNDDAFWNTVFGILVRGVACVMMAVVIKPVACEIPVSLAAVLRAVVTQRYWKYWVTSVILSPADLEHWSESSLCSFFCLGEHRNKCPQRWQIYYP